MDWQCYIDYDRHLIIDEVAKPIRDAAIIRLRIIKDGPRDLKNVNAIIEELKPKKDKERNVLDTQHYLTQLDGYDVLRNIIIARLNGLECLQATRRH